MCVPDLTLSVQSQRFSKTIYKVEAKLPITEEEILHKFFLAVRFLPALSKASFSIISYQTQLLLASCHALHQDRFGSWELEFDARHPEFRQQFKDQMIQCNVSATCNLKG